MAVMVVEAAISICVETITIGRYCICAMIVMYLQNMEAMVGSLSHMVRMALINI